MVRFTTMSRISSIHNNGSSLSVQFTPNTLFFFYSVLNLLHSDLFTNRDYVHLTQVLMILLLFLLFFFSLLDNKTQKASHYCPRFLKSQSSVLNKLLDLLCNEKQPKSSQLVMDAFLLISETMQMTSGPGWVVHDLTGVLYFAVGRDGRQETSSLSLATAAKRHTAYNFWAGTCLLPPAECLHDQSVSAFLASLLQLSTKLISPFFSLHNIWLFNPTGSVSTWELNCVNTDEVVKGNNTYCKLHTILSV